jgi:outer membrane receptor protein involved in Fe transport
MAIHPNRFSHSERWRETKMTPIRNLLSDAVRNGLAVGTVGLVGLASASAFAQNAPAPAPSSDKAKNLDRIEVMGSRIVRKVDTEPTAPVTTLTRADIEQTGLTSTYDIINHITASDGTGLSTVTTQTNGSDGTQTISLRNIGPQRTLILVDGKRWPTEINSVVDVSSIPVAIIERIEVLKDGASTIYGTDAIAGVINIITRKKYEGAQVGWSYGETAKGDGEQNSEDATIGAAGERSNAVVSLSRSQQGTVFAGDRAISNFPHFGCEQIYAAGGDPTHILRGSGAAGGANCGSSNAAFGRIFLADSTSTSSGSLSTLGSFALNNSFNDGKFQNADPSTAHETAAHGGRARSDFHHFTAYDRYNFAPVNYLQQPATRNNIFATGRFDITDNISAFVRASYTQRQSSQQLAEVPANMQNPAIFDTANNHLYQFTSTFGPQWDFVPSGSDYFNPWGNDPTHVIFNARFRFRAVGPRHNHSDFNTIGSTGGLQGSFTLGDHNFDWDAYVQYNSERDTLVGEHYINLFNLRKAVGPSFRDGAGVLRCGTPGNIIEGCVPFNTFGGPDLGLGAGVISKAEYDAMINYVSYTLNQATGNKGYNYGANLSGEIIPLQGGMLSFATGFEHRKTTSFFSPDALQAGGGSSNNFTSPTSGNTKAEDVYFELDAPLLKGLTGAQELEFNGAVRKSRNTGGGVIGSAEVSAASSSPTKTKVSMRWKPFADLLVRASYGGTFRSPSVNDLFAGAAENFPGAQDPCSKNSFASLDATGKAACLAGHVPNGGVDTSAASGQVRGLSGGNPGLRPEHGHDLTYGLVYSPSWVSGLNLTVDYWRINLKDAITTQGAATTLGLCYFNHDPVACSLVHRDPGSGQIAFVSVQPFNQQTLKVDGIDYGVTYKYDSSRWGTFGVKWDTTYNRHVQGDGIEFVGGYFGGPTWKWRSVATLDWKRGDWDANWTMRYTSALDEAQGCDAANITATVLVCNHHGQVSSQSAVGGGAVATGYNRIGAVVYHDVQVGWKAPWKAHLTLGARNLFGKEPPLVNSSFANSFDASYDLPGGAFWYFQYRQDF